MKTIHFLPATLLSAVLSLFYSCSDNTVNNPYGSNTVRGIVRDLNGAPVHPARVWLNHDTYRDVYPDGGFSFANVKTPYDLTIGRQGSHEYTCFKNLTAMEPKLCFNMEAPFLYTSQALLFITFPKFFQGNQVKFTFLNSDKRYMFFPSGQTDSSIIITINWNESSLIKGKAALIWYTRDYLGNVISYDRFGYRDTAVSPGQTIYLKMTDSEFRYNPPENIVTFHMPAGVMLNSIDLGISFDGYSSSSNISFWGLQGSGAPLTYVVPGALSLNYQIYAHITYPHNSYYMLAGHGGDVFIPSFPPVTLLYPVNNDSADFNTEFSYGGSGNVFLTRFYASTQYGSCDFNVVSESDSVRLPILPFFGLFFPRGTPFSWTVTRYNSFADINEFVSDKRISTSQYNTTISETGYFYLK
jgi:hypothetical protein